MITFLSASALAASVVCSTPAYQYNPQIAADKTITVPVYSKCVVSGLSRLNLPALRDKLLAKELSVTQVNREPADETYENMPGKVADVTESDRDDHGDTVTVRSTVHVASDLETKLIVDRVSTEIAATGESAFLRKFNVRLAVLADKNGNLNVTYAHEVTVAKPWYAPAGTFRSQVIKGVTQDFVGQRDSKMRDLSSKLRSFFSLYK